MVKQFRIVKEDGEGKIESDITVEDQQVDGTIKNMVNSLYEGTIWIKPLLPPPIIVESSPQSDINNQVTTIQDKPIEKKRRKKTK